MKEIARQELIEAIEDRGISRSDAEHMLSSMRADFRMYSTSRFEKNLRLVSYTSGLDFPEVSRSELLKNPDVLFSPAVARKVLSAVENFIGSALSEHDEVRVEGIGIFSIEHVPVWKLDVETPRKEKTGSNPGVS